MPCAASSFEPKRPDACRRYVPLIAVGLLAVALGPGAAPSLQAQQNAASRPETAQPIISKIDPPDWWVAMPEPMLLLHGRNLNGAHFAVRADRPLKLDLVETSTNGHWAFLTLHSGSAKAQTLQIVAKNSNGLASASFVLHPRRPASEQPRGFSAKDVMYLIMPDRFADGDPANDHIAGFADPDDRSLPRAYHGGDLLGIEKHLDYLSRTGITTIWTTPLYDNTANQSRSTYHGYSATDMYAVDPHLGTMAEYQQMVRAAHSHGLKVVLDTVPNHVGPANPWVSDPPAADWFHGSAASHLAVDDDFTSVTDPHATPARRHVFLDGWFADLLPDLNQDNPLVAKYLVQNAIWWIESAGLDGLRIDTFPYVPRSFWHQFHAQLHALYPNLTTVGEVFNRDPTVTSFFAGGIARTGSDGTVDTGLDTPFDFPLYFALRDTLIRHAPMTRLTDILRQDTLYPHPERLVTFIGNHDTTRFLSEAGATPKALELGFGLLATLRGMPQFYSGDEIAMTGGEDPDNRRDFPGGFAGDPANAFSAEGRTPDQQQAYQALSSLLQLRSHSPALQTGDQQNLFSDATGFAFVRGEALQAGCTQGTSKQRLLIVVNNSAAAQEITLPTAATALDRCTGFTPALAGEPAPKLNGSSLKVSLGGQSLAIYEVR